MASLSVLGHIDPLTLGFGASSIMVGNLASLLRQAVFNIALYWLEWN